jgi:hypothetical protein
MDASEIIWILGIVDSYGAVHSETIMMRDSVSAPTHGDLWPNSLKRWRWSGTEGLAWPGTRVPDDFDDEEREAIKNHLIRLGLTEDQIYYGS